MLLYRPFLLEAYLSPPREAISITPGGFKLKYVEAGISMAKLAADLTKDETPTPVYWVRVSLCSSSGKLLTQATPVHITYGIMFACYLNGDLSTVYHPSWRIRNCSIQSFEGAFQTK